ncbi:NAD(P)H-dependent oxidoreductase [Sulfurospirillum arcachonense]|uniref:NAD(P)H-dependent oxidoreductase n=1 Tax=Sulfurospirillum arcachonense TaxID=57666 RepID=UPI000468F6CB|nr:NAD(P)H-dependent oxidoreductase [Sulfurospirillum arcachonense]
MKHLIVYAHPKEDSFNHAILERTIKILEDKGDSVVVRDLYALGFNPVLSANDMKEIGAGEVPQDIATEQGYITDADAITVLYPIWWTSMPAILKGYFDRIFSYGFAFKYTQDGNIEGLLSDKKALLFSTQGAPNTYYDATGMTEAFKNTTDVGIFGFVGAEVKEHVFFGEVPTVDDAKRKEMLDIVEQTINKHF